jgi:glycosyltransferase involved in cell wall biosynthesis
LDTEENPVVSVIVPARNEEACLASCLESLVAQRGIDFEVIVVDDNSTDRTAEIARSFEVRATRLDSHGPTGKGTTFSRAEPTPKETHGTAESRALPNFEALPKPEAAHAESASNSTTHAGADARVRHTPDEGVRGYVDRVEADVHVRLSVTLIPAGPLPDGWTGKNNAMSAGAKIAKGKWLLFTDADTVHKAGSLARTIAEAEQQAPALLSYSPEQEVHGFWEKAVMPVIFAELAATYPPKKVNDPASPIAAANGQYLMISREAYEAVGGHTKIAGDLLEDVAIARLVKSSGRKIFFRYGGDAVRTRMYRSWVQMKEGWTKNLALLFKHPVRRALVLLAFWVFSWLSFFLGLVVIASGYWRGTYYLLPLLFLYGRIAWGRFRPASNVVALAFGIPVAAYLLLRSASVRKNGGLVWKGRAYQAEAT